MASKKEIQKQLELLIETIKKNPIAIDDYLPIFKVFQNVCKNQPEKIEVKNKWSFLPGVKATKSIANPDYISPENTDYVDLTTTSLKDIVGKDAIGILNARTPDGRGQTPFMVMEANISGAFFKKKLDGKPGEIVQLMQTLITAGVKPNLHEYKVKENDLGFGEKREPGQENTPQGLPALAQTMLNADTSEYDKIDALIRNSNGLSTDTMNLLKEDLRHYANPKEGEEFTTQILKSDTTAVSTAKKGFARVEKENACIQAEKWNKLAENIENAPDKQAIDALIEDFAKAPNNNVVINEKDGTLAFNNAPEGMISAFKDGSDGKLTGFFDKYRPEQENIEPVQNQQRQRKATLDQDILLEARNNIAPIQKEEQPLEEKQPIELVQPEKDPSEMTVSEKRAFFEEEAKKNIIALDIKKLAPAGQDNVNTLKKNFEKDDIDVG